MGLAVMLLPLVPVLFYWSNRSSKMRFLSAILAVLLAVSSAFAAPPAVESAAKDSTVCVKNNRGRSIAKGSAAYIGHNLFITNHHVIEGARSIEIYIPMTKVHHRCDVILSNSKADVAIIKSRTPVKTIKPVKFAVVGPVFGPVYAAGYGSSMHDNLPGEFLRVYGGGTPRYDMANRSWYRFGGDEGCSISGDSGGPAFDQHGHYIGPIWGTDGKSTYAVRSRVVLGMLATLGL